MPQISVIMPVKNGGRFLAPAVASVNAQTFRDFELVLVENGSTDGALEALEAAGLDRRTKVVRHTQALGVGGALKAGVEAARGRYLAILDQDDLAEPRRLEWQHGFLESVPDVVLLGGVSRMIDGEDREVGNEPLVACHEDILATTSFVHGLRQSTVMFRRELVERGVTYRVEAGNAADRDLFSRAAEVGRVAALPVVLSRYRWHGGNASATDGVAAALDGTLVRLTTRRRRLGLPEEWANWAQRVRALARPGMTRWGAHRAGARLLRTQGYHDLATVEAWMAIRCGGGARAWASYAAAVLVGVAARPRVLGPILRAWVKEPAHQLLHAGGMPERIQF